MKRFFSVSRETIQHWLNHPHLPMMLACLGILLTLPTLGVGLIADDYFHRAILLDQWQWPVDDASLFGIFSFFDGNPERTRELIEAGIPWWTVEDIKIAFWRPLTELSFWLDYQLWPDVPWLMHLHSVLLYGAVIWVMTRVYRKIMSPAWVAGLAALLFAIDYAHILPVGFIANRNTLIGALFGGVALLAHIRWRQEGWRVGAVVGPLCYLTGLLAKESVLAIGAYVFAYTLFLDRGHILRKITTFLPYVFVTLGWYITYRLLGFGSFGTGDYIDPGRQPLVFLFVLLERLPILLLGQFVGIPADAYGMNTYRILGEYGSSAVWLFAVIVVGLLALLLFPLFKRDAVVRFWTVGMVLGLVPVCSAFPNSRLLFFSSIGAMGILARFLASWIQGALRLPDRWIWRQTARVLCILFVAVHLVLAPFGLFFASIGFSIGNHLFRKIVLSMPYDNDMTEKTVVLVNPPIALGGAFIAQMRALDEHTSPVHAWSLASGMLPLTLTRIDERSIEIVCERGFLQLTPDRILRGPATPMHAGQTIALPGLLIEIMDIVDDWQPSHVRFTFDVPVDDASLLFLRWNGTFTPYTLPAIGDSERL